MSYNNKAIIAEDLHRTYNGTVAVDGVSFSVEPGQIFGFLGPNGAGKTTTIRMLTGQLTPTNGMARVAGCDVVTERATLKRRIGVVFEAQNLYERMSARENLEFYARLYRVDQKRVQQLLEQVRLAERAQDKVGRFSNGMKQRLVIARALLHQPQVLFLDEPTRGLDPVVAQQVRAAIVDLTRQGMTIFLTTHYMEEADQMCERVAIIDQGKIVALDTPARLKRQASQNQRCLTVTLQDEQRMTLDLDDAADSQRLCQALQADQVLNIHSQEATLEDVFVQLTGRSLRL